MEVWKDIKGYEGLYQVSNMGRVKSLKRKSRNLNNEEDRILKHAVNKFGYCHFSLSKFNESKTMTMHRVVAKYFIPNPKNKPCVNHINGIKTDNKVENLEWVTYSENMKHAYKKGLNKQIGETCNTAKLTEQDVLDIFKLKKFFTNKELCNIFGVKQVQMWRILNKKRWVWLTKDL